MNPEVERLVRRAQEGERAAFDALAELYRPRVEGLFRNRIGAKLRGQVELQDLVQETMLRAYRSLETFRWEDDGSFLRWIRGIAVHVLLETLRRTDRDRYLALDFDVTSEEPSPSRTAQRRERRERFEEAIAELSPDHRTVLRLVRLDGLSVSEAAERMGRSPNAVSQLLIRALRKLRERFGETGSIHLSEEPVGGEEESGRDGRAPGDE